MQTPEVSKVDSVSLQLPRKPSLAPLLLRGDSLIQPYRKPKQVGWARSLRLSGEGTLRNSAKKLDVTSGDILPDTTSGCNKRMLGDCLTKTQVSAKPERQDIGAEAYPTPEG
jgi:hypothetical protein